MGYDELRKIIEQHQQNGELAEWMAPFRELAASSEEFIEECMKEAREVIDRLVTGCEITELEVSLTTAFSFLNIAMLDDKMSERERLGMSKALILGWVLRDLTEKI